ncbi:MAG: hypothetical protein AB7S44_01890 [Spirochaetales bacterium]
MSLNNIIFIVNILITLFLVIGILWGIKRGTVKSFLRLSFLIFNCIFLLIVTPAVSKLILNLDFSFFVTIVKDGHSFTSLNELINYYLSSNQTLVDLIANNSIIASFVDKIPLVVINFVLFIGGYFILKSLTLPIYGLIANRIANNIDKKRGVDPETYKKSFKNKFFGALLGMFQGALTGMILFLPASTISFIFSTDVASSFAINSNISITAQYAVATAPTTSTYNAYSTNEEINNFLTIYYNTLLSNTINTMKLKSLNELIFTELSSINVNGVKISLVGEIQNATELIAEGQALLSDYDITELDAVTEADWLNLAATINYDDLEQILTNLFELKSLKLMGNDVLDFVYKEVVQKDGSLEQLKSAMPEDLSTLIDSLLSSFTSGDIESLKTDIFNIFDTLKTLQANGLLDSFKDPAILNKIDYSIKNSDEKMVQEVIDTILSDIINTLHPYTEKEIKTNVVDKLIYSQTVKRIMPDLMNLLINALNSSLDIDLDNVTKLNISWSNESTKIAKILYQAKTVGYSMLPVLNGDVEFGLNEETLKLIPANSVGKIINLLSESQLFGDLYYDAAYQVINNYIEEETGQEISLEFIEIEDVDWQQELVAAQDFLLNLIQTSNQISSSTSLSAASLTSLQKATETLFTSPLVQEAIYQMANVLPGIITKNLNSETISETDGTLINNILTDLQSMTVQEIQQDLLTFIPLYQELELLNFTSLDDIFSLSPAQITEIVTSVANSNIGKSLMPEMINLIIEKVNQTLDTNIVYMSNYSSLSSADTQRLGVIANDVLSAINSLREIDLTTLNVDDLLVAIQNSEIEKLGDALNNFKQIEIFRPLYFSIIKQTLLNKELLEQYVPAELLEYDTLTNEQIGNIDWLSEVNMVKDATYIVQNVSKLQTEEFDSTMRVDNFLKQYGNNILLNLGFINGINYLFPYVDINLLRAVNLVNNASTISGVAEIVFIYLDFEYNGLTNVTATQEYRILQAIKSLQGNTTILNLAANLSNTPSVATINYTSIAPAITILADMLNGDRVNIKSLYSYIDTIKPLIPWISELVKRFSHGYKLPYFLNVYMDVLGASVQVYSIHLGQSSMTTNTGESKTMTTEEIDDLLEYLALVPSFVTMQFVYDSTFVQPSTYLG